MYIKTTTKPLQEMSLKDLFDEFYLVPLYNKKQDGHWSDWKGERHFLGNAYTFACIFRSEHEKVNSKIETFINMSEREACWLIEKINSERAEKNEQRKETPQYLKEFFSEHHAPEDLEHLNRLSEYDPETGDFTPSLYEFRSFSPVAADIYQLAHYFRDPKLDALACKIVRYPQNYSFGDEEVREVLDWFEQDDGRHIQSIKTGLSKHPKGTSAFPFLMHKLGETIKNREITQ
ncbi:MAG: hypothetical protein PHT07_09935 [Paludibacter sp.]|nr:hypothetical protein [Paludibacter sp.]